MTLDWASCQLSSNSDRLRTLNDFDFCRRRRDAAMPHNLVQTYTVSKVRWNSKTLLGTGTVPPNNEGRATPFYNQGNNGDNPAKDGVATFAALDRYTQQAIAELDRGYLSFAGQRDDGFFADVLAVFDLLNLRSATDPGKAKDSQGGFNIHLIALQIPISDLGGDPQIVTAV